MKLKKYLKNKFLFFDGAMGTMLQQYGLNTGELPESFNIKKPETIRKIHEEYIKAGADVVTTNTFGANELKLEECQYSVEEIIESAVKIAKEAAGNDNYVALDVGPIGQLMEPMGELSFERAYEIFARQVKAGAKAGADIILIETMADIYEAKAAVLAAKENSSLPVFCTMTFQDNARTLTGTDPLTMVTVLESLGVDALGVNCSLGPKELLPIIEEILNYASVPVMVQPNAGLPKLCKEGVCYDISNTEFAGFISIMAEKGVKIIGGCCGTNPGFIKAARHELKGKIPVIREVPKLTVFSSSSQSVILGEEVRIIGERINPTGKKKLKEALKSNNIAYIIDEAISQRDAGADILDVNVGLPDIDEKAVMLKAVKEIQSIVKLPLQIDSVRADVIEAAVRIYNGKPLINSVNGKKEIMEEIFPIVKKYGAGIIGLTLDEDGIPATAEERFHIAKRIVKTAEEYGIKRENILIDCLVLTASAQQAEVMETIKAVRMVKEKLGVKTTLGVSNVSFGLPRREIITRTFLAMAMASGLDAPIINPLSGDIMETINAFKVLSNTDRESRNFINQYANTQAAANVTSTHKADTSKSAETNSAKESLDLKAIVLKGIKEEASEKTKELLKTKSGMDIVNQYLIPALDEVGKRYETGEIYLPQLIQAAETVKGPFTVISEDLLAKGESKISKGKILLATVKGDVHDIGKNIVKVLLENYGYEIIDLGKDVPIEAVVKAVKKENIKLVGLSALMTTTVVSMKDTIAALRKENLDCKVMVGGAVLNQEYADNIGADFYAVDARGAVKIAQKMFC